MKHLKTVPYILIIIATIIPAICLIPVHFAFSSLVCVTRWFRNMTGEIAEYLCDIGSRAEWRVRGILGR